MKSRNGIMILTICLACALLVIGCTQPASSGTPAPAATSGVTLQATSAPSSMANAASVGCGNMNGTTEIKKNADGSEYGMCSFNNGTSCEEWALYRGEGCSAGNATVSSK